MSNSIHLRAEIEKEETLQLVFKWHGRNTEGKLEVESITVMEDGYTKGHHWLDGKLKPDDWMEVNVI